MSASRSEQQFTEQQLTERQVTQFAELGVQYYVAARSAAWGLPVCRNLYHHALEMLLKAGLSGTIRCKKTEEDVRPQSD
jgi:hypothetical protein